MLTNRVSERFSRARKEFLSYLSETTVHGFRYIVQGNNTFERLFWILVIISGFLMSGHIIRSSFLEWDTTPLQTTVEKVSLPVERLDFPAITVCHPETLQMPRRNRWIFLETILNSLEHFKETTGTIDGSSGKLLGGTRNAI